MYLYHILLFSFYSLIHVTLDISKYQKQYKTSKYKNYIYKKNHLDQKYIKITKDQKYKKLENLQNTKKSIYYKIPKICYLL